MNTSSGQPMAYPPDMTPRDYIALLRLPHWTGAMADRSRLAYEEADSILRVRSTLPSQSPLAQDQLGFTLRDHIAFQQLDQRRGSTDTRARGAYEDADTLLRTRGLLDVAPAQAAHVDPQAAVVFIESLLNPNLFGYAVTPAVRDEARRVLGLPTVETRTAAPAPAPAQQP